LPRSGARANVAAREIANAHDIILDPAAAAAAAAVVRAEPCVPSSPADGRELALAQRAKRPGMDRYRAAMKSGAPISVASDTLPGGTMRGCPSLPPPEGMPDTSAVLPGFDRGPAYL
jgi:hypothetical protein